MTAANDSLNNLIDQGGGRNLSLDFLKGLCIILVVIGHLYGNSPELRRASLYSLIYTFHMPFFMVLSGWVAQYSLRTPVNIGNLHLYVWKKFRSLILPCFMWVLAFRYFFIPKWDMVSLVDVWNGISSGYWYMPCLFLLYIYLFVATLICKRFKQGTTWIISALILGFALGGGVLVKDEMFRTSMSYSLYFVIGYLLGCKENIRNIVSNDWVIGIALIGFCLIAGFYSKTAQNDWVNKLSRLTSGLFAIPVLFKIGQLVTEKYIKSALVYIGQHTLAIYMIHYAFINNTPFIYLVSSNSLVQFSIFFIYACIICGVCIFIERLCDESPITKYLFFGKIQNFVQ